MHADKAEALQTSRSSQLSAKQLLLMSAITKFGDCLMLFSRSINRVSKRLYDKYFFPAYNLARVIYNEKLRGSPKWLRVRFSSIKSTKPLRCNPTSQTELHTLTCHNHLFMYITAIKSLLRFVSDIAVVVHDDGSLTTRDIANVKYHINGIRVIRRGEADKVVGELLASFPKTSRYRAKIINSLELTDHALLASKRKIIITNSDILFLRQPDDVIQWIAADHDSILCVYEEAPFQQAEFLARAKSSFPPHLTLALVCLHKDVVDPQEIEELLSQVQQTDVPWFIGQNSLPVLIGKNVDKTRMKFLDQNLYQASGVFNEGAIFRHYWTSMLNLRAQYFADAATVIADLK